MRSTKSTKKDTIISVRVSKSKKERIKQIYQELGYISFNSYLNDMIERELNDYTSMLKVIEENKVNIKQILENISLYNVINNTFFKYLIEAIKKSSDDLKNKKTDEIIDEIYAQAATEYVKSTDLNFNAYIQDLNQKEEEEKKDSIPIIKKDLFEVQRLNQEKYKHLSKYFERELEYNSKREKNYSFLKPQKMALRKNSEFSKYFKIRKNDEEK